MTAGASSMPAPSSGVVVITGCLGGIGQALVHEFNVRGYTVIGLDLAPAGAQAAEQPAVYLQCDLARLASDEGYRAGIVGDIRAHATAGLAALVNNAAWQVVKPVEDLSAEDWVLTQQVNVTAPFLLSQALLAELERAAGGIVNIASIHASLTKPHFVAYATSKAALIGLTRALAVELGARVKVNSISPAAIETPMLVDGFKSHPARLDDLKSFHPMQRIGLPAEVARAAVALVDGSLGFMTGADLNLDGGIGARLHDPA